MSDRERTITAAMVAGAAVVLAVVGLVLYQAIPLAGFALMALGGLGAVQAVLIGFGLMRVGERHDKRDR